MHQPRRVVACGVTVSEEEVFFAILGKKSGRKNRAT